MIKVLLQLIAIHGVLCAPGVPFLRYGPPVGSDLKETSLPSINPKPVAPEIPETLPGTENLIGKSQLPVNLPGTRNLDEKSVPDSVTKNLKEEGQDNEFLPGTKNLGEKSIPDSVTLKKIPIIFEYLELPRYSYDGRFSRPEQYYPYAIPSWNEQPTIEREVPREDQPSFAIYPNPTPDVEGGESEIKETELVSNPNTPETSLGFPPRPENGNNGENSPSTPAAPIPGQDANPGAEDQFNIPPGTSIKVQDLHGQYSHGYSNPDGTQVEESGHLISTDDGWEYVIAKTGSYQYLSPEGIPIRVSYIADENGFRILSQSFGGR